MIFQSNFLNSIYKQSKFSYKKHIIPKTERNAPQIQFNDSAKFPIFSLDMPKTHFKTSSSTYSLSIKPMAASPRVINLNIQDKSQQFLPKYTEPKSHRFSERKQRPLSSNMTRTNGVSLLESDLETFVVGNLVKPSSKEARIKKRLQDMDIKDYKREGEPYLQYLFYKKRL